MSILTEGKMRHAEKNNNSSKVPTMAPPSQKISRYPKAGDKVKIDNYHTSINGETGTVKYRDGEYIGVICGKYLYELYPCEVTLIK